jgi:hypothetical protein
VTVAGGRTAADAGVRPTILSWRCLLICLGGGILAAGLAAFAGVPEIAVLLGWAVAASGLLFWVWRISWPRDPEGTKRLAEEEGRTRVTDTAVLGAAVARPRSWRVSSAPARRTPSASPPWCSASWW